jgi:hypothetical protein
MRNLSRCASSAAGRSSKAQARQADPMENFDRNRALAASLVGLIICTGSVLMAGLTFSGQMRMSDAQPQTYALNDARLAVASTNGR